ncbi:MAG TPA: EAL domain-containing protein [Gallionella sp.]|nr:EAL domain-containing protein [Gallionella sp.]
MTKEAEHQTARKERSVLSLLPWLVLAAGLLITYGLQDVARQHTRKSVQERFDFRFNEIVVNIEARLRDYEDVLHGTQALFASSESVERGEFREYVGQLRLDQRYPGIRGVGFAQWLSPADKAAHIRQIRKEGFPDYTIRPGGERDSYTSIIYLEPFDWRNQRAFGYDMYSEPVRRAAMERARDENRAIVSGKVILVQETEKDVQPGFLMYLPVYRNGLPHETLAERRTNLAGWVYAPFRTHDLMNGIMGRHFGEIGNTLAFDIYDGDHPSPASLMYDFSKETGISRGTREPVFRAVKYIDVGGHQWTVAVRSLPDFEARLKSEDAQFTAIAGITGSLLASFIVWLLATGRERAFATATEMTRELRESESRTRRLNRALKLLSDCNMTLVRAKEEHKLLSEICRLIVERGGYQMAWVGFAEQDAAKTVRPVAQAGYEEGYLDSVNVTWSDTERGQGPTGTAIRTGVTDINQDYLSNPRMAPWREAALKRGYQSSIALPLAGKERILGALTLYSPDPHAFNPAEVTLLEELANDLAFGIETLRARTEHRLTEEKLGFLAQHDPLTKLPNRLLLRDRFDLAAAAAERERSGLAMLFLDLDNFKQVNETLGHNLGDQLLRCIAERLNSCIRDTDTISRQGGDEFTILLADVRDLGIIGGIAQDVLEAFSDPVDLDGRLLNVSSSIGIGVFPNDGVEFDTLLKKAETAMYHAKESGRNTYRFFNEQMNIDALEQLQMQSQLRNAIKNGELRLHYQAQIDIGRGGITGFEALVRWNHPEAGMIAPAKFIPLAERSGLIIPIGEWVLNEACRQAKAWLDSGHPLVMAVNLSALQFRRGNLLETVADALERSGLPPRYLELELTESILLHDMEAAMQTLHSLKAMGVKLSIDDFGTGYSSLSYLKRLAVDKLKIDQSFVRDLTEDPEDAAIVKAIIQLGHTLQLSIIAEGVETDSQLAFLRNYGCDEVQGYFFSRPIPPDEASGLLAKYFLPA